MTEVGISVSEIQKITGCHYQQGIELYNRILERDNDKLDQLEQMARELLGVIEQIRQPIDPVLDVIVERSREVLGVEACPFCGGEDGKHSESCYITMSKENVSFINLHHTPMYTSDELLEAYHARYKRTCKMEPDPDYDLVVCSECGYEEEIHLLFPSSGDQVYDGKFCPSCGAEVVDGD